MHPLLLRKARECLATVDARDPNTATDTKSTHGEGTFETDRTESEFV